MIYILSHVESCALNLRSFLSNYNLRTSQNLSGIGKLQIFVKGMFKLTVWKHNALHFIISFFTIYLWIQLVKTTSCEKASGMLDQRLFVCHCPLPKPKVFTKTSQDNWHHVGLLQFGQCVGICGECWTSERHNLNLYAQLFGLIKIASRGKGWGMLDKILLWR